MTDPGNYPPPPWASLPAPADAPRPAPRLARPLSAVPRGTAARLPEIVIVPAHPGPGGDEIMVEVREGADGGIVLPTFSSVPKLVEVLGPAQPWLALPLHRARLLATEAGARQVVLDPGVRPSSWRWGYHDLHQLEDRNQPVTSENPPEVRPS